MAAAAILKNRKSAISPERFNVTSRNLAYDAEYASKPNRKLKFQTFENPRWRTAAILKNEKSPYLSRVLSNFDRIWHADAVRFS